MTQPRRTGEPQGATDPTELREEVDEELDAFTEEVASEEVERMAERDRIGVDEPNDEVNQSAEGG
jgi:hypothetical protein